jgi:glycosyltransferase involved in cell wall biosynthesis
MKILYLHQYFTTPTMPGGTRSYELARRLVLMGHEVQMITSRRDGAGGRRGWHQTEEAGVHVHWLPVPYSNQMGYRDRLKAFAHFAWSAGRRGARIGGDVVFATSTPLTIALPGLYAARRSEIPMVFEVRDLWPEVPIALGALKSPFSIAAARWLEKLAYDHSTRIVALSVEMKAGIMAAGYPGEWISVIPNGCDLDAFEIGPEAGIALRRRYEWLQDRPLVLYTGTLGLVNGVDYLARLAAEARLLDPEVRFLVIGGGREEEKVRATARTLGVLDHNFFMMPSIQKCEVPAWLSAADIATSVVIDRRELWANSANKVFDALAAGRPVAINHGGWQADLLRETGAGMVLDPGDPPAAARQLIWALNDRRWLERAGTAARAVAHERFARDLLAAQLEATLLAAVVERGGRDGESR